MHRLFAAVIFSYFPLRYGLTSSASLIASVALRWRSGGMVMKRLFLSSILLLTVMVSPSGSFGADFQKGMDAAQRGAFATALKEWKPLAEQGVAPAQNNLGHMHQNGKGVPQDHAEAFKWYRLAANQGVPDAQLNLGVMYGYGYGVKQDYTRALMWWAIAASQGDETARKNRDIVEKKMSSADISKAQKLAREWMKNKRNRI